MTSPTAVRRTAGIVGAGTMGAGVAQCLVEAGYRVVVYDPVPGALDDGRSRLAAGLRTRALLRPGPPVESAGVGERMCWTADPAPLADAEFVIECGPERVPVKRDILATLDATCAATTVIASNTSAIPITRIAGWVRNPERVLGMHFMNPAPLKDTVEVIRALHTSDETIAAARELLAAMGKDAVLVADAAGFVSNRVLMLTVNEAAFLVHERTAPAREVDQVFRRCFGHPMGPLETADLIGLDVILDSLDVLYEHYRDPKFRPCPLLAQLVYAGHHGRKSGRGFHTYRAATGSRPG
ncbi:3-hydroxyacyl-CoA dehydrogenase NAD-binding domain-containing protein [Micromonospora sp. NBRC 101691]|uniref:3-hydroxyacyl-CoA dehydrogenase family protein n=1 Tax=Micromonospora sp. NBRC 101691 TaxID=3032198 RepID=UPI002553F1B0|nr:3-hydroxyacyl-CoA dehydrogenase NAD-binding domain-containing protein [Micromonospora sp. NBRC 101691]